MLEQKSSPIFVELNLQSRLALNTLLLLAETHIIAQISDLYISFRRGHQILHRNINIGSELSELITYHVWHHADSLT